MKVGDVVQINDLCVMTRLHGAIGTVIEGPFYEKTAPWAMIRVLVDGELLKFRQGDAQLEII